MRVRTNEVYGSPMRIPGRRIGYPPAPRRRTLRIETEVTYARTLAEYLQSAIALEAAEGQLQ